MAVSSASRRVAKALTALAALPDPLERLETIHDTRVALERLAQEAVDEARASGATWKQIGALYGISKQAAQQRFRRPASPPVDTATDPPGDARDADPDQVGRT